MALLTQKVIMKTFREMLEEMPFDKITVSALVKRCEISSNTFYYHYQDIYELLSVWLRTALLQYVDVDSPDFDWVSATKAILYDFKANPKVIYHIFDCLSRDRLERYVFSLSDDIFYKRVCQQAAGSGADEKCLQEITSFCRYAFMGFVMQFLWNQMEADIDESVDRMDALFRAFVSSAAETLKEKK